MTEAAGTLPSRGSQRWRRRLLVALGMIVSLAVAGYVISTLTRVKEPVYQGKGLSVWLQDTHWTNGGFTVLSVAATQAVQAMGTNALPYLLQMMRGNSSFKTKTEILAWRYLHLNLAMGFSDQQKAMFGFFALGPVAKPAYPDLVKLVLSVDHSVAVYALRDADADTVALVAAGLKSPDVKVRRRAAFALGNWRQAPAVTIPALTEALSDPDTEVKTWAATWIGHYGPAAKAALPALASLTNSPNVVVGMLATEAMKQISVRDTNPPVMPEQPMH